MKSNDRQCGATLAAVTVTAALIVRNEEGFLQGCLNSLRNAVDDVVVVDTGSTDSSRQVALGAGARLIDFAWTDDFSAARNVALDHADADWILYIDADERIMVPDGCRIVDFLDPMLHAGGLVRFRPRPGYTCYLEPRLFCSDPAIRFKGRIHETHVPDLAAFAGRSGRRVVSTPVMIEHIGYEGDQSRRIRRNLPLLEAEIAAHPDRTYCWHHLAETLALAGYRGDAIKICRRGLDHVGEERSLNSELDRRQLEQTFVRLLVETGEDPGFLLDRLIEDTPDNWALLYLKARTSVSRGWYEQAIELAHRFLSVDPETLQIGMTAFDKRLFGEFAWDLIALAHGRAGRLAEAASAYKEAWKLAPDKIAYYAKAIALGADLAARL